MAFDHLRTSLTRGNLWLYVLSVLAENPSSPQGIKRLVKARYGFSPATITFYSVLYKLKNEGLVRRTTDEFRSDYELTPKGAAELERARRLLEETGNKIGTS